jgi:hypothetical protein
MICKEKNKMRDYYACQNCGRECAGYLCDDCTELAAYEEMENYTPHEIVIYETSGERVFLRLPSKGEARAEERIVDSGSFSGVQIVERRFAGTTGLPEYREGICIIVSESTARAARAENPDRHDLLCPDTGPDSVVRDENGRIIGVRRLSRPISTVRTFKVMGQLNDVGGSPVYLGEVRGEALDHRVMYRARLIVDEAVTTPELTNAWVSENGKFLVGL